MVASLTMATDSIGIYVHIPFCLTLCPYCDFVRVRATSGVPSEYVDALCREIVEYEGPVDADTLFIGGGTPSLLAPAAVDRILRTVRARFRIPSNAEVTIEANADDVSESLVRTWHAAGITRVSLGVQSFDDRVLRYLGRRHDADTARRACAHVARVFDNWSMDLIFGAPPIESWDLSLSVCADFSPPHVSTYGLTFEPATPFAAQADDAVDDERYLRLYWRPEAILTGMDRYEVSNWAKPGFECRHNLTYWHNTQYAGFGPGAYSFIGNVRACNTESLPEYMKQPGLKRERISLSQAEIRVETVIQHLRLASGLPRKAYEERFSGGVHEHFGPQLDALIARGLVEEDRDCIRPTRRGLELNNEIGLSLV